MNVDDIRAHCLQKENVEECFPFDEDTLVFKVNGKMFLLVSLTDIPLQFNVKCDPEKAIALREEYMQVQPGYHMSKVHWNTILTEGGMSRKLLLEQIDHSYELVAAGGKKKKRS